MRRVITFTSAALAAAALALSASGCGDDGGGSGGGGGSDGGSSGQVALAYDIGGRGDQSFNDAAYAGFAKAKKEFGLSGEDLEPTEGESDADKVQRLTELARMGADPVIAVGFAYAPALEETAPKFPDTTFGIVDDASVRAENIANLVFAEEQSSYLAGVAAAGTTESDTVGFIGGMENNLIRKFEAGYVQGVKDSDPSVKVLVKYLSQPPDDSGFQEPALGKNAARGQLDAGADVIYHAAGNAGNGVIEATANAGKWVIGVDSDQYEQDGLAQYKDRILTSATKDVSGSVYKLIKSVVKGEPRTGVIRRDLADGGVGLSDSNPAYRKMTAVVDAVTAARKKIVNGGIEVSAKP